VRVVYDTERRRVGIDFGEIEIELHPAVASALAGALSEAALTVWDPVVAVPTVPVADVTGEKGGAL